MRAFGWPSVYDQHENGWRGFDDDLQRYAKAYRVREEWLAFNRGAPKETRSRIDIGGTVGLYGIIQTAPSETAMMIDTETVESPPGDSNEYTAYLVSGDHNYPALFAGDVIFAARPRDPRQVLGRQCVATLADGTKRICILALGSAAGLYMLLAINATPLSDVEVVEAAPVILIQRGKD